MTNDRLADPVSDHPLAFMRRATPQLRAAVETHALRLPPADFQELVANVRALFAKYTAKLLEFAPGVQRGTALHHMLDRELKAAAQIPVSCRKGCSGCCHYEVEVTQDEAAILRNLVLGGVVIDFDRLDLQAARERQSPEWKRFGHPDNRCVFLGEDGACRVYEDRPAICRKHIVTTPVSACTTEGAAVAPVQVLLAEILLSADLSLTGTDFGSLASMLAQSLHAASGRRAIEVPTPGRHSIRALAAQRDALPLTAFPLREN